MLIISNFPKYKTLSFWAVFFFLEDALCIESCFNVPHISTHWIPVTLPFSHFNRDNTAYSWTFVTCVKVKNVDNYWPDCHLFPAQLLSSQVILKDLRKSMLNLLETYQQISLHTRYNNKDFKERYPIKQIIEALNWIFYLEIHRGEFTYRHEVDSRAVSSLRSSQRGGVLSLENWLTGVIHSASFLLLYILVDSPKGMHSHWTTRSHMENPSLVNYICLSSGNASSFITTYLAESGFFFLLLFYVFILTQNVFDISEAISAAWWQMVLSDQEETVVHNYAPLFR